jgi:hypothetical protein
MSVDRENSVAQTQAIQAADVLDSGIAIDIRAVAANFVRKRLNNATSVEDIREEAIRRLAKKIEDPGLDLKPQALLNIVETLGNQSAVDLGAIMKAQETAKAGGRPSTIGIFFGAPAEGAGAAPASLTKEAYQMLDKLVVAADAVLRAPPARVVDAVDAAPVTAKKSVTKKKPVVKKVAVKAVVVKKAPAKTAAKNAKPKRKS